MKTLFLAWLVSLSPLASAQAAEEGFQVQVDPKVYSPAQFEQKGAVVRKLPPAGNHPLSLPSRERRESTFERVPGLASALADFDELDRDLLFLRAETKSLKDLKKFYPKLTTKLLARLQKEIRK